MNTTQSLFEGVIVMVAIISLVVLLKKFTVLKKEDSLLFSRIVLQVTLPALIFSSLAVKVFDDRFVIMAAIMAVVEIGMIILAWLLANLFKFQRGEKGALILVSAFGMTTMLGYPIIQQVFPNNPLAMEEAVVTSEFGVGLLLFILGPLIAMYYGESKVEGKFIMKSVQKFFVSPIFISLVAGIAVSFIHIDHNNQVFTTMIRFFELIGNANLLMVAITIGLIIEFKQFKNIYLFLGMAVLLKLIVKPLLAVWLTNDPRFTDMMREIVVIETALPSAILSVVFAKQYNCRPDLVAMAIMVTLVLSVFSVSLLFIEVF
ncbi:MAG: AEC family transporter [Bacteroidales bacterium]|nr:AEC family transporter [Bacteroidales bacterium]